MAALTWPASLLTVANVIDNPWGVCLHRSAEVGKHLAHILLSRQQVPGLLGEVQGRREVWKLTCAQMSALKTSPHGGSPVAFWGWMAFTAPTVQVTRISQDGPVRIVGCAFLAGSEVKTE